MSTTWKTRKTWKTACILLVSITFLLLILSSALAEFNYSENIRNQEMSIRIEEQVYTTASKLSANISLSPPDDGRQSVVTDVFPKENLVASMNSVNFKFNNPGNLDFGIDSIVNTKFKIDELKEISLDEMRERSNTSDLAIYKKSSNYSDSDNVIIKNKALQLAKSNDSIEVLYSLAEYVRNSMTYNSDNQELQKASEIILSRQGVCSHYTILFISLARALGFPARYVSGVAYSNKINDFQEHAWAEVWLPDLGWVPFDVTFGQYGWLDSSHVVLKRSLDAGDPSVKYSYSGGYIQPGQILTQTQVLNYSGNVFSNISIKIEPYKDKVSQESYVPIRVQVINNNDYYIALPLRVSIAPQVYGDVQKILLLKPNSFQETYFLVYVPYEDKCSRGCKTYVEIKDIFNNSDEKEIEFSDFDERVTFQEAQAVINEPKPEDVNFYCDLGNVSKMDKTLVCSVISGESENMKLCYEDQCSERFFQKGKPEEILINIQTNQSNACIQLQDESNLSLDSCVDLEKQEKSWVGRFVDWINFQLTGFIFFIQSL